MGKVISEGNRGITFAKGGTGKMFGKGTAGRAESDVSGKEQLPCRWRREVRFRRQEQDVWQGQRQQDDPRPIR